MIFFRHRYVSHWARSILTSETWTPLILLHQVAMGMLWVSKIDWLPLDNVLKERKLRIVDSSWKESIRTPSIPSSHKLPDVSHAMLTLLYACGERRSLGGNITTSRVGPKQHEFDQDLTNKIIQEGAFLHNLVEGLCVREISWPPFGAPLLEH